MINLQVIFFLVSIFVFTVSAYYHPYQFSYAINDPKTGDHHQQRQESDGRYLKGYYFLKEGDETTRLVKYRADPDLGFHADVEKIGIAHHPDHYKSFIKQINGYENVSIGDNKKNIKNNAAMI